MCNQLLLTELKQGYSIKLKIKQEYWETLTYKKIKGKFYKFGKDKSLHVVFYLMNRPYHYVIPIKAIESLNRTKLTKLESSSLKNYLIQLEKVGERSTKQAVSKNSLVSGMLLKVIIKEEYVELMKQKEFSGTFLRHTIDSNDLLLSLTILTSTIDIPIPYKYIQHIQTISKEELSENSSQFVKESLKKYLNQ